MQQGQARESLGAAGAAVLPGVRVRLQVRAQVGAIRKGPAAVRAGVGLLPCVVGTGYLGAGAHGDSGVVLRGLGGAEPQPLEFSGALGTEPLGKGRGRGRALALAESSSLAVAALKQGEAPPGATPEH